MPYAATNPATGQTERDFASITDEQLDAAIGGCFATVTMLLIAAAPRRRG